MTIFTSWENFYVIVGSAAGALIGLQFVVLTLIAGRADKPLQADAGAAFSTPTIVYFSSVLLLSGAMTAPWHGLLPIVLFWAAIGLIGIAYSLRILRILRRLGTYKPEFEDWLFHAWLPLLSFAAIALSALLLRPHLYGAPFGVAAAALLLLFTGIHNAWDIVTYHVFTGRPPAASSPAPPA